MSKDRMFHVIVLGGLNLVACGGVVTSAMTDGGPDALSDGPPVLCGYCEDGFPSELPGRIFDASPVDAAEDAFPSEGTERVDAFPIDSPTVMVDSPSGDAIAVGSDGEAADVLGVRDAFPLEGPQPPPIMP